MEFLEILEVKEIVKLRYKMFEAIGTTHLLIEDFHAKSEVEYFDKMNQGMMIHYGLQIDGKWVGCAGGILKSDFPSYYFKDNSVGYIMDVYIDPDYRGNGYAKALVKMIEDWFKKNNVNTIKLDTSRFGRPMYEKLGYENSIEMQKKIRAT